LRNAPAVPICRFNNGHVSEVLADRMTRLGAVITEAIVHHYGATNSRGVCRIRFWFQSFGAVMGMDWHSSGITTSVLGALKRGLAPLSNELGLHVCGDEGSHSRKTPGRFGSRSVIARAWMARRSRVRAAWSPRSTAPRVQDGFDLYLHGFIVADDGKWGGRPAGHERRSQTGAALSPGYPKT